MNIVIIDNYDSFTYNLAHLVKELGAEVTVLRNDRFRLPDLGQFDKIILSPGPGIPSEAGLLLDVIDHYAPIKPILGVCLGHQAIGEAFGAQLENLSNVFHGVATQGTHTGDDYLFDKVPRQFTMGRYHSWVVSRDGLPECIEVTAVSNDSPDTAHGTQPAEQIMALRHKVFDVRGIQFHPESVLTPDGKTMIDNWLKH